MAISVILNDAIDFFDDELSEAKIRVSDALGDMEDIVELAKKKYSRNDDYYGNGFLTQNLSNNFKSDEFETDSVTTFNEKVKKLHDLTRRWLHELKQMPDAIDEEGNEIITPAGEVREEKNIKNKDNLLERIKELSGV